MVSLHPRHPAFALKSKETVSFCTILVGCIESSAHPVANHHAADSWSSALCGSPIITRTYTSPKMQHNHPMLVYAILYTMYSLLYTHTFYTIHHTL